MRKSVISILCIVATFYSIQTKASSVTSHPDTLTIISFNDFHGAFAKDQGTPGAGEFTQMLLDAKAQNPNTIIVSVGDNFSGSYFSRITRGEPLPEMYKTIGVEMSAVGNHEFDWGLPYLTDTAAKYINFVSANIVKQEKCDRPDWLLPYRIVQKQLGSGQTVNIAFVGLTTTETAHKTNPENIEGLEFTHPLGAACEQTLYYLKDKENTDMIVLLAHIGTDMAVADRIMECNAKVLPYMDGVSALITGHSHKVVLDRLNGMPVIQAGVNGAYIGKLQFVLSKQNEQQSKFDITYLRGDTIKTKAATNPHIDSLVNTYIKKHRFDKKLTTATDDLIHNRNINKFAYTPVGALVTAAYARCFTDAAIAGTAGKPVIGINHYGGLRTSIHKGDVSRLKAGNVLPFGGNLVAYNFDGKRLKQLLNAGRSNKNGFLQSSFLTLTMENDKITRVEFIKNGKPQEITDTTPCIVVLDDFITSGGDGYDSTLFTGYEIAGFNHLGNETTTAFINFLDGMESISTEMAPMPLVK